MLTTCAPKACDRAASRKKNEKLKDGSKCILGVSGLPVIRICARNRVKINQDKSSIVYYSRAVRGQLADGDEEHTRKAQDTIGVLMRNHCQHMRLLAVLVTPFGFSHSLLKTSGKVHA